MQRLTSIIAAGAVAIAVAAGFAPYAFARIYNPASSSGSGASFGQAWEIGADGHTGFLSPTTTVSVWAGQASSTVFSANWAKIGGSASTTIDTAGNVTLAGTLTVGSLSGAVSASTGVLSAGTLSIGNGGTNATSFTTSGNSVYYNGTSLLTAPTTAAVTTPFASSTSFTSAQGAWLAASGGRVGIASTTPWALFSINPDAIGTVPAFAIGSTTKTWLKTTNGGQTSTCETVYGATANGADYASSTSITIDFQATCNQVLIQLGFSATTITASNAKAGDTKRIVIANPGGTAGALTWSGFKWYGGTTPTQTTTANSGDAYGCIATQASSTAASTVKIECGQSAGIQ